MRSNHPCSLLLLHFLTLLLAATSPALAEIETAALDSTERLIPSVVPPLDRLTHSLSAKQVKKVVVKAPEKLNLGADNFLGSGLKRKSVSGAYGTTAAVGVGAAAITYQTLNLKSKSREASKKAQSRNGAALQAETAVSPGVAEDESSPILPVASNPNTASQSSVEPIAPSASAAPPVLATAPASPPPATASTTGPPAASNVYAYPPSRALTMRTSKRTGTSSPYAYPPSRALYPKWSKRAPISDATLITIEDYNKIIGATEAIASGTIAVASA
ncbi:uncharacterized protein SPSC_03258 [Sporisorium scitamineum]|uniref:Uncharacterized protein n=1 Tax=Sporisorium scitamineum TaxID=49012 RepID=A0A127Z8W5_9BASI|nr:uncharacterized protein SPSC_03258 [Sporisorium scitamineum]